MTDPLEVHRVLDSSGALVGPEPAIGGPRLTEMYRLMALSRFFDRRALAAQRQGRLGTYAMLEGHEAV